MTKLEILENMEAVLKRIRNLQRDRRHSIPRELDRIKVYLKGFHGILTVEYKNDITEFSRFIRSSSDSVLFEHRKREIIHWIEDRIEEGKIVIGREASAERRQIADLTNEINKLHFELSKKSIELDRAIEKKRLWLKLDIGAIIALCVFIFGVGAGLQKFVLTAKNSSCGTISMNRGQ